jgi:uncharacterized membrane protein YczE
MKILFLKTVPVVSWSSKKSLNFAPGISTLSILCAGLVVFGVGEALLIAAGAGVSPWTVFAQGISIIFNWSIGYSTLAVSVGVLLFWIPLKQVPGLGTLLNATVIAVAIELSLPYLPQPELYALKVVEIVIGILMVGLGSGMYLIANLGPGPRDGLMLGLQRLIGFPIAIVRMSLEISAVVVGWLLGGTVGLGTLLFALGIGYAVSIGLFSVSRVSTKSK